MIVLVLWMNLQLLLIFKTNARCQSRAMPNPTPSVPPRHRWKVLAAGAAANAAFSVAFSGLPMTAVLMRSDYRLDNATLGLVLGLMSLGIAVSELPWGLLTDRWGDRPVLLLGLVTTALALLAMALWAAPGAAGVPPVSVLCGGLLLVGLLGGSVNGASGRAVMVWFDEGERGLAMSVRQTAVPLGGALGAVALPTLVRHAGFAAAYGFVAALCLAGGWMAWAWIHEPAEVPSRATAAAPSSVSARPATGADTSARTPARGPLHDRRVWRIVLGIGLLCAPQFAVISFGTVFLRDVCHAGWTTRGSAMFTMQLGAMVARVWSGRWTDRHANRPAYLRFCGRAVARPCCCSLHLQRSACWAMRRRRACR
jgi:sugar phosphate permease